MKRKEQLLQISAIEYLNRFASHTLFFHVQNNAKSKRMGGIYKAMGVMPGVADILMFWDDPDEYINLKAAIELKSPKGKQSTAQCDFMRRWTVLGGKYAIIKSMEELEAILLSWGIIKTKHIIIIK